MKTIFFPPDLLSEVQDTENNKVSVSRQDTQKAI